jgi:dihydroorotate dehydrogenase (fumarate)
VHSAQDALKLLGVGANVTMMASELLLNGVDRIRAIRSDLEAWLVERQYDSIKQLQGSTSHRRVAEPAAFERAHYLRTVGTFSLASTLAVDLMASTYGIQVGPVLPSD